jgi:AbrB family looped-hinge helix DNA binding protein
MGTSDSGADDHQTSRVTDKGQTTIPKSLREKYGIGPGDEVRWVDTDDGIRLVKAGASSARGSLAPEDADADEREAMAAAFTRVADDHVDRDLDPT